ncbi:uncharacterized protein Dwil_GK16307 [Drosophila willistoni]|uniref:Regulatory protein zeste n=1 Tax=Drosophila willistoni TaxID=7260 RepID=B4NPV9_DROWI|nr:uncharacterized protein LOC6653052 [Drosophila willistoni]XP_023037080.1 uncharacterized protein LOC6653052 [Drosophila willistoni]XP_023037081.1 uncharacterized protein LOC6653052 [Drosophila willistoni]EDW86184.2 uncharacterized protein Dwil_GK16307 [Drosophila willistoni]
MEKTPRYTQRERNMVLGYAAQYKDVIENKRTDAESNRKKDEVWLQIAKEFNLRVYHQRSSKQLRQLYKNMKLLLKKDLCGEEKGNRSFMDVLNTLSQQESVAQYIADQMSPDGATSQAGTIGINGPNNADDYEDTKVPLYDGLDTDVIMIKSETISDNEQTVNGMDCLDDDDDDDCLSPKAPEVCLEEEEDEVLFATDLRQLQQQQHATNSSSSSSSLPVGGNHANQVEPMPQAASSPVLSTKTTSSSTGSYSISANPNITIQNVGQIRVGSFANINKTLQNGGTTNTTSATTVSSPTTASNTNANPNSILPLTAEQVQQHLLLNGLGLSAVNPPPSHSLQAAINSATRNTSATLQLPRLQRGNGHNSTNPSNGANVTTTGSTNGLQLLINNGHHQTRDKTNPPLPSGVAIGAAGSFNGYNGLAVTVPSSSSGSSSANSSGLSITGENVVPANSLSSAANPRAQHQEYIMSLAIEERKRKIDLLNAQIEYWQTLTKKLDSQTSAGHLPNPACLCHLPSSVLMGNTAAAGAMQSQTSGS